MALDGRVKPGHDVIDEGGRFENPHVFLMGPIRRAYVEAKKMLLALIDAHPI
jgi:hypothetical protein